MKSKRYKIRRYMDQRPNAGNLKKESTRIKKNLEILEKMASK